MVGSGMLVAVAEAVFVGVTVGVAVGLGVCVRLGVAVGGMEVGSGSVGIKLGKRTVGVNAIFPNAITARHSRTTRTARIPNCGHVRLKKGLLDPSEDPGIQDPFTSRVFRNKGNRNYYHLYISCKKFTKFLQSVAIIPIHYPREKGQCWLSEIYRGRNCLRMVVRLAARLMQNLPKCWIIMEKTKVLQYYFMGQPGQAV
jgi:hypothetical protein